MSPSAGLINLDVSNNGMTRLIPQISQLGELSRFNLSKNSLTDIPPEIGSALAESFFLAVGSTESLSPFRPSSASPLLPPCMAPLPRLTCFHVRQI